MARNTIDASEAFQAPEPSTKNYFLDKGYSDLGATIREAFTGVVGGAIGVVKGAWAMNGLILKIVLECVAIPACVAIFVFGLIVTVTFSIIHSFVLMIVMLFVTVSFTISRRLDSAYLKKGRIAYVCEKCKHYSEMPGYKCPKCGAVHYQLKPNVYGIFTHKCTCGQKLPATYFASTKDEAGNTLRRAELQTVCANPMCQGELSGGASTPIVIPVVGSRSVGKTAYITAVSHELIEDVLPAHGCSVSYYSPDKENLYHSLKADYGKGTTTMTQESLSADKPSAFSLSFFARKEGLSPDRLFHLFDVAGETFARSAEREAQLQYGYANGVVLVIDPFSIQDFNERYIDDLNQVDRGGIGGESPDDVLDHFIQKAQQASGLASKDQVKVPLAIVINKIDEAGLAERFDAGAREAYKAANPACAEEDVDDALCRRFLREFGMGGFIMQVAAKFEANRFFSASAIGHTRDEGAYSPKGVMQPVEWIVSQSDPDMAAALDFRAFPEKPYELARQVGE